ncbi:uncharacterized protein LOC109424774 isoform X1 [Aedes albopictus]|uniref:Uncharacterized protein n=1 Tax=Aedes albopictus TaxID=7160 RepID=A0ABM1ZH89_AEDAL
MDSRSKLCKPNGIRYTEPELDAAAYELMAGGNSNYQFIKANMQLPSSKTLKRHIAKHTTETQEGILMVTPLLKYLNAHNYPLVVSLSEDGTTLSPNPEYDSRNDSIRGLVAPLNHSGMPEQNTFNASTVEKMINDLERYSVGEYLYIVMATPMAVGASPFCILYMCSDNRFTHDQVISRWNYIESELLKAGITVIANASDGDPRLLMAMRQRSTLHALHVGSESQYGPHFAMNNDFKLDFKAISIQDSIHLVNKFRHSLLDPKKQMRLGDYVISSAVLKQMMENGQKMIHKLNPSDLNAADRMKFDPSLKLMSLDLIDHLIDVVPGSIGTATYIQIMRHAYLAFNDEHMSPIERITSIWTALLFVRAWRQICISNRKTLKDCPTSNVYHCLELNAHGLVKFIVRCRQADSPEQFIITHLSSQPCETTFRELRSMTTVNHTAVNFTMKEVEQRMQKVQMKLLIVHRRKADLNFPCLQKQQLKCQKTANQDLPNDDQIRLAIDTAAKNAEHLLTCLGVQNLEIDFRESMTRNSKTESEFEFVSIESSEVANNSNDSACKDACELNEYQITDGISSDAEVESSSLNENSMKHIIEDAEKIFSNAGGELLLRQCSSENNRNVFYVKGINGKVISIKKSTMLWMLSSGRFKRSNDRLRRFHQIRMLAPKDSSNQNCIKHEISTGDWIALQGPMVCHVTNFQYQTGKKSIFSYILSRAFTALISIRVPCLLGLLFTWDCCANGGSLLPYLLQVRFVTALEN